MRRVAVLHAGESVAVYDEAGSIRFILVNIRKHSPPQIRTSGSVEIQEWYDLEGDVEGVSTVVLTKNVVRK